jgi:hypothetical protein
MDMPPSNLSGKYHSTNIYGIAFRKAGNADRIFNFTRTYTAVVVT